MSIVLDGSRAVERAALPPNPGFYGMMEGIEALLRVDGHAGPLWFGHVTFALRDDEIINTLSLSIANKTLQQMGWIETN